MVELIDLTNGDFYFNHEGIIYERPFSMVYFGKNGVREVSNLTISELEKKLKEHERISLTELRDSLTIAPSKQEETSLTHIYLTNGYPVLEKIKNYSTHILSEFLLNLFFPGKVHHLSIDGDDLYDRINLVKLCLYPDDICEKRLEFRELKPVKGKL